MFLKEWDGRKFSNIIILKELLNKKIAAKNHKV
jgi:hypothetical protein